MAAACDRGWKGFGGTSVKGMGDEAQRVRQVFRQQRGDWCVVTGDSGARQPERTCVYAGKRITPGATTGLTALKSELGRATEGAASWRLSGEYGGNYSRWGGWRVWCRVWCQTVGGPRPPSAAREQRLQPFAPSSALQKGGEKFFPARTHLEGPAEESERGGAIPFGGV